MRLRLRFWRRHPPSRDEGLGYSTVDMSKVVYEMLPLRVKWCEDELMPRLTNALRDTVVFEWDWPKCPSM